MANEIVGIGYKPPAHVEVKGTRFSVQSFMPVGAFFAMKSMGFVSEDGEMEENAFEKIGLAQVAVILKFLVINPVITDEFIAHSEAVALMSLFTKAVNEAKIDEDMINELKQGPTRH